MTGERHLTQSEARRLTLALQHISVPAQGPLDVVRRLTVIQSQYAANLPGALWARTPNVTPAWVDDALNVSRTLVKMWTVRGTLHTIASEDYAMHIGAYCQEWLPGRITQFGQELGVTRDEAQTILQAMVDALADGPLSRTELHARVPELKRFPNAGWGHDLKVLVYRGDVVFAQSRTSTSPQFASRVQWLAHLPFEMPDPVDSRVELIRRYFRSHAPASFKDTHVWMGLYAKQLKLTWERVLPELVPLTIEGLRGTFFIHQDDLPVLDALPDAPKVRMLPKFDELVLAHRGSDKLRLVDAAFYKRIYGVAAQVEAVVLLDGDIVGTWRYKTTTRKMILTFDVFRALRKAEQGRIEKEAVKFAAWNGFDDAEVKFVAP